MGATEMGQDEPRDMYAAVGRMLADWNSLEWDLVHLIGQIGRAPETTNVLTAHMASQAICDALRALATQNLPADVAKHIRHGVDMFEALRAYRNQFVHRVTAVIGEGPTAVAFTYGMRVNRRGELQLDQAELHRSELDLMMGASTELSGYFNYLRVHVAWVFDKDDVPPRAFRHWPPEKPKIPPPLPSPWGTVPPAKPAGDF